ncbi:MAG: TetR/AcrR family transcriptional regulator [Cyanobacteria bacterium P01_G01_bin.39]
MKQNTAQQILDAAQSIVRNRGYSAFSYADIAQQIGIRKASIHYHFPSKDYLVRELVKQYRELMERKCFGMEQQKVTPQEQLREFVNLYRDGLRDNQICLCGMLTADFAVLHPDIKVELQAFFVAIESWLAKLLQRGNEAQAWNSNQSVELEAKTIIAMLQGTQLIARAADNSIVAFESITEGFLKQKLENR